MVVLSCPTVVFLPRLLGVDTPQSFKKGGKKKRRKKKNNIGKKCWSQNVQVHAQESLNNSRNHVYLLPKLSLNNPLILPQVGHIIYVFVDLTEKQIKNKRKCRNRHFSDLFVQEDEAFSMHCSVHQMCFKV